MIEITDAMFVSSNVTDLAPYDDQTTYAKGDQSVDPVTHLQYESAVDGNLGNAPAESPSHWTMLGYVNSRRMIDGLLGRTTEYGQTQNAESVELVLDVGQIYTSIVVFNVSGASVTVSIEDNGTEVFSQTKELVDLGADENIWDYFFVEPEYRTIAVFPSVPGFSEMRTKITVSAPGGTAKVGEALLGRGHYIGETVEGSGPRIKDYSVKEYNEFGEEHIVERGYARGAVYEVAIDPQDADRITRILEKNRTKLCAVFPAEDMEHYGLTVAGRFQDYEPGLTHRGKVIVTIPIIGGT